MAYALVRAVSILSKTKLGCKLGLHRSQGNGKAEFAKLPNVTLAAAFQSLRVEEAAFNIGDLVVQDFPDDAQEPMGNRPDGRLGSQPR